jgi:hypothetical protein
LVRVRQFELRLLAIGLTVLWAAGGGIVLIGYRPGGPLDVLVGIAASTPLLVAVAPIVWPPLVTSNRGSAGVFWIGILAGLLLIPSLGSITAQVIAGGTEPLLPSVEVVYPWALALLVTGVFAGLGISRQVISETGLGPRRLLMSGMFALAATSVIGVLFVGVSLADDAAVRSKPQVYSPFGPTSASLTPSGCDMALNVPTTATESLQISGTVDTRSIGTVALTGSRRGKDFSWAAQVDGARRASGTYSETRIGASAWSSGPGGLWSTVPAAAVDGDLLDATVLATALERGNRATAEDRGFEYVAGARARRCRVAIDGATFEAAFPQVTWLVGSADIETWRGEVDYWIFSDDEVGEVTATVNGNAQEILTHGLMATVEVKLTATDRGAPVSLAAPKP